MRPRKGGNGFLGGVGYCGCHFFLFPPTCNVNLKKKVGAAFDFLKSSTRQVTTVQC
jgi:hypothetical protein